MTSARATIITMAQVHRLGWLLLIVSTAWALPGVRQPLSSDSCWSVPEKIGRCHTDPEQQQKQAFEGLPFQPRVALFRKAAERRKHPTQQRNYQVFVIRNVPDESTPSSALTSTNGETTKYYSESLTRDAKQQRARHMFVALLAILSGITDAIFCKRFGFYANMMTGNTIRLATALAECRLRDSWFFAALILSYTGGVTLAGILEQVILQATKSGRAAPWQEEEKEQNQEQQQQVTLRQAQSSTLYIVAIAALFFLSAPDWMTPVLRFSDLWDPRPSPWAFSCLAVGFGLVNAATMNILQGTVTNAATGHYTKLGRAAADAIMEHWKNNVAFPSAKLTTPTPVHPPTNQHHEQRAIVNTSARFILIFMGSMIVSSCANNWVLANLNESRALRFPLSLGTALGILYALVLGWYGWVTSSIA